MDSFFQAGTNNQLVVAFHGTGGNEYQLLTTVAELFPAASLLSFRGPVSEGAQRRFFAPLDNGQLDRRDFEQHVSAFLTKDWPSLEKDYQEVIFIGYSNGANFILGLLEQEPTLADTVILLHPSRLVYSFNRSSDTTILLTVGAQDTMSLPGEVLKLSEELKVVFPNTTLLFTDSGHELSEQEIVAIQKQLGGN